MTVYQTEIEELNKVNQEKEKVLLNVNVQMKEKEIRTDVVFKQIRVAEKERDLSRVEVV